MQYRCSCGRITDLGMRCTCCSRDICLSEQEFDIDIEDLLREEDREEDQEDE